MTDDEAEPPDQTQVETEFPRGPGFVVQLVPRPSAEPAAPTVHELTVMTLEKLLADAKAGEITNVVVVSWRGTSPPHYHSSTDDKIVGLGAISTMHHMLFREWMPCTCSCGTPTPLT